MDSIKVKDVNLLLLIVLLCSFLFMSPLSQISIFIIIQAWAGKNGLRIRDFLHYRKVKASIVLLSVLIAVLMKLDIFVLYFKSSGEKLAEYKLSLSYSVWLMIFAFVLAPLAEELLFRGVLYNFYKKKGVLLALVLSSLFFSLFHFNLHGLIGVFFIGAILALLYEITQSIWVPVLVHGSYNALSVLFIFDPVIELLQTFVNWIRAGNVWLFRVKLLLISILFLIFTILVMFLVMRISGNNIFEGRKIKDLVSINRNDDEPLIDRNLIFVFVICIIIIVRVAFFKQT